MDCIVGSCPASLYSKHKRVRSDTLSLRATQCPQTLEEPDGPRWGTEEEYRYHKWARGVVKYVLIRASGNRAVPSGLQASGARTLLIDGCRFERGLTASNFEVDRVLGL